MHRNRFVELQLVVRVILDKFPIRLIFLSNSDLSSKTNTRSLKLNSKDLLEKIPLMLHSHSLPMPTSPDLDVVEDWFHFHSLIHFYTIVYVLPMHASIDRDHLNYVHVDTRRNHLHEYQNGNHRIHVAEIIKRNSFSLE